MAQGPIYAFGPFQLDAVQLVLVRNDQPIAVPPKNLQVLLVLVRNAGRLVTKEQLLEEVWPNSVVEEGNLSRNIFELRQVLSFGTDDIQYIETVPKRGYRFARSVETISDENSQTQVATASNLIQVNGAIRGKQTRLKTIVLVSAVIIAGLAALLLQRPERPIKFAPREVLLVSDFENHTGEERFNQALTTALVVGLEQSEFIGVASRSTVRWTLERMKQPLDTPINEAVGREICEREGLRALLAPSITKVNDDYAVSIRLLEPKDGSVLKSYMERAQGQGEILDALERLADRVRAGVGEPRRSIGKSRASLELVTTPNLQALQFYTQATSDWKSGRYDSAINLYKAALALDPDFAMAHHALANAYNSHIKSQAILGAGHLARAVALSDRVTIREKRKIEADYAISEGKQTEAEAIYDNYLKVWPGDRVVRWNLANFYMKSRKCEQAIPHFEQLQRETPQDDNAFVNASICYVDLGKYELGLRSFEHAIELRPTRLSEPQLVHEYALLLYTNGFQSRAYDVLRNAIKTHDWMIQPRRTLAMFAILEGNYVSAIRSLREAVVVTDRLLANSSDLLITQARNRIYLAYALIGINNRVEAIQQLNAAATEIDTRAETVAEFNAYLGQAYLRANDITAASKRLDAAQHAGNATSTSAKFSILVLEADLALSRGQTAKAAAILKTIPTNDRRTSLLLDVTARSLASADETDAAINAYRRLIGDKAEVIGWEAQFPWLAAHTDLARLYLKRREPDKAVALAESFLSMWKDATPTSILRHEAHRLRDEAMAARAQ